MVHIHFFASFHFLHFPITTQIDLAVLLENRFPPVRVRGRGDFILYIIFFALEVQGSQTNKNIASWILAMGGIPAPIF